MWSTHHPSNKLAKNCVPLTEEDCKHLLNAGLKVQDGVNPRDLYCYHYLPEWYDGTPLQVLRLIEEIRALSSENLTNNVQSPPIKLPSPVKSKSPRPIESAQLTMTMKVTKRVITLPSQKGLDVSIEKAIATPLKPTKGLKSLRIITEKQGGKVLIDEDENKLPIHTPAPVSTRKRKNEIAFSPRTPDTTSPRWKTRRTSILQKYETPEQDRTVPVTPMTEPATPRRFILTEKVPQSCFVDVEAEDDQERLQQLDELSGGLVDDVDDRPSGECCAGTLEPIWDVLHRTSSHFQNVWDEVRDLSSTFALPLSSIHDDVESNVFTDPMPRVVPTVPDFDLVYQGDDEPSSFFRSRKSQSRALNELTVDGDEEDSGRGLATARTRRQRQERCRLSATTWRLW